LHPILGLSQFKTLTQSCPTVKVWRTSKHSEILPVLQINRKSLAIFFQWMFS
jgi:hypothetical protein